MNEADLTHLRRCVELARTALQQGEKPFGSVLVSGAGEVLAEEYNWVVSGDETRHPELALARWAGERLDAGQRAAATVYTSGEHCPMCSAAHGWVGLGRIVYASSSAQLSAWREEWGLPAGPVRALSINEVAPDVVVDGPAPGLDLEVRALHARLHGLPG